MREKKSEPVHPHEHEQQIVMVCVTRQLTCARLIEYGEEIAQERKLPLHVVHAVKTGENFLGNIYEGEALEYLFTASQLSGGVLSVLRADDVQIALEDYARSHDAKVIVAGASPGKDKTHYLQRLCDRLTDTELRVVE